MAGLEDTRSSRSPNGRAANCLSLGVVLVKLKGHIWRLSLGAFIVILMYLFPTNFYFPGLLGLLVFIYVARLVLDRRQNSKPKPKKEERVCCKRCSGEEPWPGDA